MEDKKRREKEEEERIKMIKEERKKREEEFKRLEEERKKIEEEEIKKRFEERRKWEEEERKRKEEELMMKEEERKKREEERKIREELRKKREEEERIRRIKEEEEWKKKREQWEKEEEERRKKEEEELKRRREQWEKEEEERRKKEEEELKRKEEERKRKEEEERKRKEEEERKEKEKVEEKLSQYLFYINKKKEDLSASELKNITDDIKLRLKIEKHEEKNIKFNLVLMNQISTEKIINLEVTDQGKIVVLTGGNVSKIYIYKEETYEEENCIILESEVNSFVVDSQRIYCALSDNSDNILIMHLEDTDRRYYLNGHSCSVTGVAITNYGYLLSADISGKVVVWKDNEVKKLINDFLKK